MATDNVKPTATDLSLKLSSITANSITIKWSPATDNVTAPKNIFYVLYRYDVVYKPGKFLPTFTKNTVLLQSKGAPHLLPRVWTPTRDTVSYSTHTMRLVT